MQFVYYIIIIVIIYVDKLIFLSDCSEKYLVSEPHNTIPI